ncbi:MAG: hypothetical protein AAGB32_06480 [Pseudomonadota bacterium]
MDYEGQCFTIGLHGERKLTRDVTGDSGTEITLRLGFKNLGDFGAGGLDPITNNYNRMD